jgi:hypothetical protein
MTEINNFGRHKRPRNNEFNNQSMKNFNKSYMNNPKNHDIRNKVIPKQTSIGKVENLRFNLNKNEDYTKLEVININSENLDKVEITKKNKNTPLPNRVKEFRVEKDNMDNGTTIQEFRGNEPIVKKIVKGSTNDFEEKMKLNITSRKKTLEDIQLEQLFRKKNPERCIRIFMEDKEFHVNFDVKVNKFRLHILYLHSWKSFGELSKHTYQLENLIKDEESIIIKMSLNMKNSEEEKIFLKNFKQDGNYGLIIHEEEYLMLLHFSNPIFGKYMDTEFYIIKVKDLDMINTLKHEIGLSNALNTHCSNITNIDPLQAKNIEQPFRFNSNSENSLRILESEIQCLKQVITQSEERYKQIREENSKLESLIIDKEQKIMEINAVIEESKIKFERDMSKSAEKDRFLINTIIQKAKNAENEKIAILNENRVLKDRFENETRIFKEMMNQNNLKKTHNFFDPQFQIEINYLTKPKETKFNINGFIIEEVQTDNPMVNGEKSDNDDKLCIICLKNPRDIVLLTCGHFIYCENCFLSCREDLPLGHIKNISKRAQKNKFKKQLVCTYCHIENKEALRVITP